MNSIREQIETALQRPKINKETVYGILKQIVDVIEPPASAPAPPKAPEPAPEPAPPTPKRKTVKRVVKKKVAEPKE